METCVVDVCVYFIDVICRRATIQRFARNGKTARVLSTDVEFTTKEDSILIEIFASFCGAGIMTTGISRFFFKRRFNS